MRSSPTSLTCQRKLAGHTWGSISFNALSISEGSDSIESFISSHKSILAKFWIIWRPKGFDPCLLNFHFEPCFWTPMPSFLLLIWFEFDQDTFTSTTHCINLNATVTSSPQNPLHQSIYSLWNAKWIWKPCFCLSFWKSGTNLVSWDTNEFVASSETLSWRSWREVNWLEME